MFYREEHLQKHPHIQEIQPKNRLALIEATLDSVAEVGLLRTTVTEITSRARLSRGMIHLHFSGKDNLILEAAKFAYRQYFDTLERNIPQDGVLPNRLIEAIVQSDLGAESLNQRTASIWYELRGAARTNAEIFRFSDTRDDRLRDRLHSAVLQIYQSEVFPGPEDAAQDITTGLIALLEGLWTDYLLHPKEFDRDVAMRVIFRFLMGIWPEHFDIKGAIA